MYRPENWEEISLEVKNKISSLYFYDDGPHDKAIFEAGADAILEALKQLPSSMLISVIHGNPE